MVDLEKLCKEIDNSGLKKSFIAQKLNLSRQGFANKLNGERPFNAGEIQELSQILSLSIRKRDEIFFA